MIANVPFLEKRFETFNRDIFAGQLPPVPIKLSRARRSLGSCTYKKRRKLFGGTEHSGFCIRISTCYDLSEKELEDILLHEMIHYEILVGQHTDTSAHGKLFRNRMKFINDNFGRDIRISYRLTENQETAPPSTEPRWNIVALVTLKDGRKGIKVLPRTKQRMKSYRLKLKLSGWVESVEFFWSDDKFFCNFPKSSAPNVFFPKEKDFESHFLGAERIHI